MHEPERLHPDTLKLIRVKVRELGYLPNQSARSLASRRSRIVAAIVPTLMNSVYAGTLQGLSDGVRRVGFELMLGDSGYSPAIERSLVGAFIGRGVDALVLTGVEHDRATRDLVRSNRMPVAEIWDLGRQPLGLAVGFSNRLAGEAVGALLSAIGRRRWGFVGVHPTQEHRSRKRLEGFSRAAESAGVPPPKCAFIGDGLSLAAGVAAATLLFAGDPPDAVFCANDVLACGVLQAARESGRRVPDDLALVGFGDFDVAAIAWPPLTTVRIPGYRMGLVAAQSLTAALSGESSSQRDAAHRIDLGFELVRRATA